MAADNLARLIETEGITAVVNYYNDGKLSKAQIPEFYSKQLLDKLKLASSEYKHLGYAKDGTAPAGHGAIKYRRWGTLTAHITPLIEGIPPKSDQTNLESIEGTWDQFGRYMEFTDKVSWDILDSVVVEYTQELSDVAVRTLERLCRYEMLQSTFERFANLKANIGALTTNDQTTYMDYRIHALLLTRLLVKKINGYYEVLISPEHKLDLLSDPLVRDYMEIGNDNTYLKTGEIPPLIDIKFVENQLDEFTFGYELANPGEWFDGSNYHLRVFIEKAGVKYFYNIPDTYRYTYSDRIDADSGQDKVATEANNRLANGSWIPVRTVWDVATWLADNVGVLQSTHKVAADGTETTGDNYTIVGDEAVVQLPVHTAIMLGHEALIKTGIDGKQGANMYVKPLGSAGVLDPIDQRQSIGFKIDAVGFMITRDECITLFHGVPTQALLTSNLGVFNGIQYE